MRESSGGLMFTTFVAVALLVLCIAAATAVAFLALRRTNTDPRTDAVVRYASVTAITAVGSSAMHLFAIDTPPSPVTLLFGDIAMMCGPALLWVTLRAVTGRRAHALWLVGAAAVALAAVILLAPAPLAVGVRSLLLAGFGALAFAETWHTGVRSLAGVRLIRVAMAVFSTYMLSAGITAFVAPGAAFAAVFAFAPMTVVGIAAIGTVAVGAILAIRDLQRRDLAIPADAVTLRARESVSIPDFAYMPVAYGHAQAEALDLALLDACRSIDPAAERLRPGTVAFAAPDGTPNAHARVRSRFAALIASQQAFVENLVFSTV